jgi:NADPH:quinone reductase
MKAIIISAFGGTEVLQPTEVPKPFPTDNELLVKVYATSVNPVDCKIRSAGAWAGIKPPAIIGYDVSGVVEAVGGGVKDFKIGDEVFYTPEIFVGQGSYAEYHVVNEAIAAHKPSNLTHIEAASIPLAGGTAWEALVNRAGLEVGETVLIHAGAGGIGTLAIQIAKAIGAYVIATCRPANNDLVKQLGADHVIDYRSQDFVEVTKELTGGLGVDVVLDTVGGDTLARSIAATKPHGEIVSVVNTSGNLNGAYIKNVSVHFMFLERDRAKLESLRTLITRDQLKPVIDCVLPLYEVAKAHQKLEAGGVRGKIVLEVG